MVGVPGKYKGCNTCRIRRVKCDNTRPFCKNCVDYGRECGGYEREIVFIVGTQNDKGRVGSHPPRNLHQSRSGSSEAHAQTAERPEFVAAEPLQPAWNEDALLRSGEGSHLVRIVARHAERHSVMEETGTASRITMALPDAACLDVTPTFREENFNLRCSCFVHLPDTGDDLTIGLDQGTCLFLYQQNSSTIYTQDPQWNGLSGLADAIREPGPAAYQTFPAHHFFARVYRPSAIWAALLNRQPTFLCNPEWTVVPWEKYPRTALDDLLDIVVLLPSIFSRADNIIALQPESDRRLKTRELLDDCINIETQFNIWLSVTQQRTRSSSEPYWVAGSAESTSNSPFQAPLSFASPLECLVHVYYWTFLITFHRCIYALLEVISEPENNGSGPMGTYELPPGLDSRKYQPVETRNLAALVCRSLDFALQTTTQPDLLAAPVWVIKHFYNSMRVFGLCEHECLWIDDLGKQLEDRVREMNAWVEDKHWVGIGRFGV